MNNPHLMIMPEEDTELLCSVLFQRFTEVMAANKAPDAVINKDLEDKLRSLYYRMVDHRRKLNKINNKL